jgi:hypothetical protein
MLLHVSSPKTRCSLWHISLLKSASLFAGALFAGCPHGPPMPHMAALGSESSINLQDPTTLPQVIVMLCDPVPCATMDTVFNVQPLQGLMVSPAVLHKWGHLVAYVYNSLKAVVPMPVDATPIHLVLGLQTCNQ